MKDFYVVDVETTGFDALADYIVEVGVVRAGAKKIEIVIDAIVNEVGFDPELESEAWVFENSTLTPADVVKKGVSFDSLKSKLSKITENEPCAAYNLEFDMGFLASRGVYIMNPLPDPMLVLTPIIKLPRPWGSGFKWPKFPEAYFYYFEEWITEPHRAAGDAKLEALLILEMIKENDYNAPELDLP